MTTRNHMLPSLRALLSVCLLCMTVSTARADEVAGTVRDESGNPIEGADFNVYDAETGVKLAPSDNTDAAGKYRLIVDPGKRYDFLCQPGINSGFAPRIVRAVLVTGPVTLDYVLPPSAQARGRVTDTRNPDTGTNGVFPCDLDFDRVDDGSRQPALGDLTSPFGTFVSYLEGGAYNVTATPADTALAPGRVFGWTLPTTDILPMPLLPAAFVAGTIRDSNGQPVAGATLKFDDTVAGRRLPSTRATSNAAGFIRMGVTPGVYRVTVEPASGTPYAATRVADVDLTASRFMDFTVAVGAIVSG
ncbi:MAG: carboxypeptidase-like regulatory domain-containing protein, partial [Candidatus Eisenbacteria bacterium]